MVRRNKFGFSIDLISMYNVYKRISKWMKQKKRQRLGNQWTSDVIRCKVCLRVIEETKIHIYVEKFSYCDSCFHSAYAKEGRKEVL